MNRRGMSGDALSLSRHGSHTEGPAITQSSWQNQRVWQ